MVAVRLIPDKVAITDSGALAFRLIGRDVDNAKLFLASLKNGTCTVDVYKNYRKRTKGQNDLLFVLVGILFELAEGRRPTDQEKRNFVTGIEGAYGEKRKNPFNEKILDSIPAKECDTRQMALLIDGAFREIAEAGGVGVLGLESQNFFQQWQAEKGLQKVENLSEAQWREHHTLSQASGLGVGVDLHHILRRSTHPQFRDNPANWVALTRDEHSLLHSKGDEYFLQRYPHLRNIFERAHRLKREEE